MLPLALVPQSSIRVTFLFTDFDYLSDGVAGAYWEISREFTLAPTGTLSGVAAHVEYDGGLASDKLSYYGARFQIGRAHV